MHAREIKPLGFTWFIALGHTDDLKFTCAADGLRAALPANLPAPAASGGPFSLEIVPAN